MEPIFTQNWVKFYDYYVPMYWRNANGSIIQNQSEVIVIAEDVNGNPTKGLINPNAS